MKGDQESGKNELRERRRRGNSYSGLQVKSKDDNHDKHQILIAALSELRLRRARSMPSKQTKGRSRKLLLRSGQVLAHLG